MHISFFLLLSIFDILLAFKNKDENIITFRRYSGRKTTNITTRYGNINFRFDSNRTNISIAYYIIENIKNLNLFSFPDFNCKYEIYGKNNDSLKIIFENEVINKCNNLIARLFYETKYIDKIIYAIGYDGPYCECEYLEFLNRYIFRFYGGAPNRLTKNLIKHSFSPKDLISEMNILYKNGTKIKIQIDQEKKENNIVEFTENNYFICFPEYILEQVNNLILKGIPSRDDGIGVEDIVMYDINYEIFNGLPENYTFKINNKIITINKYDLSPDLRKNDLFIQYTPCHHFVFGNAPFLRHVDMREYNFETNETNLYVRKNNSILIEEKEMKTNSYKYNYFIIAFILISAINIFIFWRKNKRQKNIEEYNNYYIV